MWERREVWWIFWDILREVNHVLAVKADGRRADGDEVDLNFYLFETNPGTNKENSFIFFILIGYFTPK